MRKGKASQTALKVAMNTLTLSTKPGMAEIIPPGFVDATEKLLEASGVISRRTLRWARSPKMVAVYEAFDWILPGQFEAFGYRKAFCEDQVRAGIRNGVSQVLVLGAGYDTLGWRLAPEFPAVNFFEIDHPATASLKAKGIEALGQRENLFLLAEDLGKRKLVDVLGTHKEWHKDAKTVIIAEGLVMYLPAEAVQGLFRQCGESVGVGSRLAFSYIPSGEDGRLDVGRWSGLMLWLQKKVGEPWLWSIRPKALAPFLEANGWRQAKELIKGSDQYGVEYFAVAAK